MRVVSAFLLLSAVCSAQSFPFDVKSAGEVVAYLSVEAPKADWGVRGREASVLALRVDNGAVHHLMTWGGPYRVFLGRLDAGRHELVVAPNNSVPFKVTELASRSALSPSSSTPRSSMRVPTPWASSRTFRW